MAAFFAEQADFILFFYGLALILLGVTCFAIAKHAVRCQSWHLLGLFGLVHGAGEWLELTALVVGDNVSFAALRTAVMTASYVLLVEFARQELARQKYWVPGPWIYLVLLSLVLLGGAMQGLNEANAIARYSLGIIGSLGACTVFLIHAQAFFGPAGRLAVIAAVGFALYAIAAGAIVPFAPLWPADTVNQEWFLARTGVPIQLVRGTLACCIAVAIWGIWGQKLIAEVASARYTRYLHKQFVATVVVMGAILLLGWGLTEYFGLVHKQHLRQETQSDLDLLAASLSGETAPVDAVARSVAGSPTVLSLLTAQQQAGGAAVGSVLTLGIDAAGARRGYILNTSGTLVAFSGRGQPGDAQGYAAGSDFRRALAGEPVHELKFDATSIETVYIAAYPVRGPAGDIVGVTMLERSLKRFDANLAAFTFPVFLVDPQGIVTLSNRPDLKLRWLWPQAGASRSQRPESPSADADPILQTGLEDGSWANVEGDAVYVRQRHVAGSDWSLVIFMPIEGIFASRVLGIAITLLATIMVLIYIVARERAVHDTVQMDRRLALEELARLLDHKATTDPLTGLSNRLKFDEALGKEIVRSRRFGTPLSLIFYDIDHFKQINDSHGHQIGDDVLIELSALIAQRMRATDLLARWGGEEFAILVPHSDAAMTARFAELLKNAVEGTHFDKVGTMSCSFGVAQLKVGETAEGLVARADGALYRAKLNGRNRVELAGQSSGQAGVGSAA